MRSQRAVGAQEGKGGLRLVAQVGVRRGSARNRTLPGKYMLGSWQNLAAADAQKVLKEEVITTQQLMVVRCRYGTGSSIAAHAHPQEQITIVESGTLQFNVSGESIEVGPGQMISIFPGVLHSSEAIGSESVRALNIFHAALSPGPLSRRGRAARLRSAEAV